MCVPRQRFMCDVCEQGYEPDGKYGCTGKWNTMKWINTWIIKQNKKQTKQQQQQHNKTIKTCLPHSIVTTGYRICNSIFVLNPTQSSLPYSCRTVYDIFPDGSADIPGVCAVEHCAVCVTNQELKCAECADGYKLDGGHECQGADIYHVERWARFRIKTPMWGVREPQGYPFNDIN